MKLLAIIPSYKELSGVDYHRLFVPFTNLAERYKDIEVSVADDITSVSDEALREQHIVICNRQLSKIGKTEEGIERIKKSGCKFIVDLDDDYKLPQDHVLYASYGKQMLNDLIKTLKAADYITVTHERLAEAVKEVVNRRTFIWPNAIDASSNQFQLSDEIITEQIRFGWCGSITHVDDVADMYEGITGAYNTFENFAMVYGGFAEKDIYSRTIAGMLSCGGRVDAGRFYYTQPTSPNSYAFFYDLINVMLIPLRENRFNSNKSNLKLLEAGFKKRACIVSDVHPYKDFLTHKNCLKVSNKKGWFTQISRIMKNPTMRFDLANQLYEDVQPFEINKINVLRYQTLKHIWIN